MQVKTWQLQFKMLFWKGEFWGRIWTEGGSQYFGCPVGVSSRVWEQSGWKLCSPWWWAGQRGQWGGWKRRIWGSGWRWQCEGGQTGREGQGCGRKLWKLTMPMMERCDRSYNNIEICSLCEYPRTPPFSSSSGLSDNKCNCKGLDDLRQENQDVISRNPSGGGFTAQQQNINLRCNGRQTVSTGLCCAVCPDVWCRVDINIFFSLLQLFWKTTNCSQEIKEGKQLYLLCQGFTSWPSPPPPPNSVHI